MTLDPLLSTPLHIQIHALCASFALLTGPIVIYRTSRDTRHKTIGYLWMLAMLITAITAFWISSFPIIGRWSPIHLFAILTVFSLILSLRMVWKGNIRGHMLTLRSLYWNGLVVAAILNFLPKRMVNAMFIDSTKLGWIFIMIGFGALLLRLVFLRFHKSHLETKLRVNS